MSNCWKSFFAILLGVVAFPFAAWAGIEIMDSPQGRAPIVASTARNLAGRFLAQSLQISESWADDFPLLVSTPRSAQGDVYAIGEEFSIQCRIPTGNACHVNLFSLGTRGNLIRLFPNQWAPDSLTSGSIPLSIPPTGARFAMKTGEPPGTDLILAIAVTGDEAIMKKARARASGPFAVFEDLASAVEVISEWTSPEPGKKVSIRPLAIHTRGSEPGEGAFSVARDGDWVARVWVDNARLQSGQPLLLKILSNRRSRISSISYNSPASLPVSLLPPTSSSEISENRLLVIPRLDEPWVWVAKGPSETGALKVVFVSEGSKTVTLELPLKIEAVEPSISVSGFSSAASMPLTLNLPATATAPVGRPLPMITSITTQIPLPAAAPKRVSLTAFFDAVRKGNNSNLQAALQTFPWLIEARGDRRATALHWAASEGKEQAVGLLASAGAWINSPAEGFMRPLHLAAWRGHTAVVRKLIGLGASLNPRNSFHETPLLMAVKERQVGAVGELLKHKALVNISDSNGTTPLDWALMNQDEPMISLLKASGASKSTERTKNCIHDYAMEGHIEALKTELLRSKGAVGQTDAKGRTPLHLASLSGHGAIVDFLLTSCTDPNPVDDEGRTPLHLAAGKAHAEIVGSLIKAGASSNSTDMGLQTPVHLLISGKSSEALILECLKKFSPDFAKISTPDEDGNHPVHLAIRENLPGVFHLLKTSASAEALKTSEGLSSVGLMARHAGKEFLSQFAEISGFTATATALSRVMCLPLLAAESGNLTSLEFLLNDCPVLPPAADGGTLLHAAAKSGMKAVAALALQHQKLVDAFDLEGNTPLHLAAARGESDIIESFLEAGADPCVMNGDGLNSLHLAAISGSAEGLLYLLKKGTPIDGRSSTGDTALHLAAEAGNVEIVERLVTSGAQGNQKDSSGKTAAMRARALGFDDIAGYLEKEGMK